MKLRKLGKSVARAAILFSSVICLPLMSGCERAALPLDTEAGTNEKWQRPPVLETATWQGSNIVVSGVAEPFSRVVLAEASGHVFASSSDSQGRFQIDLTVPAEGIYLKPRLQLGQEFVDGQGLVFLRPGQDPLAVSLRDGEASYRLSHLGALDAVDSDGSMVIISGHAQTTAVPKLRVDGQAMTIELDALGHWAVAVQHTGGPLQIQLNEEAFTYPGVGRPESGVEFVSGGWRISRKIGDKAVQSTWLPVVK